MNNGHPLLQLRQLTKRYAGQEIPALDQLTLTIEAGEILALVGASGSGKTTLLRLIAGLERPDKGEIRLDGECMSGPGIHKKTKERAIGLVFQQYALFPHLTALQNVMFGLDGRTKDKAQWALELLDRVGLQEHPKKFPHQLSGGQQQRVALARAMAAEPKILLLDEPFSHLDTKLKDQLRADIRRIMKQEEMTAVFVTHDTRDALSTADRIAVLESGQLQQLGSARMIYEKPANDYVATFFGRYNQLTFQGSESLLETPFGSVPADVLDRLQHRKDRLYFRPEDIHICSSGDSALSGHIEGVQYLGSHQNVTVKARNGDQLFLVVTPHVRLREGELLYFKL